MKELENILRQLLFVDPEKPMESGAIWPLYPEDDNFPKIVEAIQELLKQEYQRGYDDGYGPGA